jgi:WD40 repeat protein
MALPTSLRIVPLAEFKPIASSRAWASVPNPNGLPLIATATSDKTVRVYSLKNFTLHSTLEGGHSRSVRSVAWKPSVKNTGKLCLATGSFDSNMAIWKREETSFAGDEGARDGDSDDAGENTNEFEVTSGGEKRALPKIQSADSDGEDDWEFVVVLEGHEAEVKHVAYSPSGQWLASCSRDKSIWIWEEIGEEGDDEWETVAVLQDHTADVKCVSWRKDDGNGEVIASGSYDNDIRFYKDDGEGEWSCIAVLSGHTETVWSLAWEPEVSQDQFSPRTDPNDFSPRIPRLLSSSADQTIRVWKKAPTPPAPNRPSYFNPSIPSTMRPAPSNETWECVATLPKVHDLPIYSVSWSAQSGRVVSTGGDGKVAVYEEVTKGRSSVGGAIETEWKLVAISDGGHGPYEINHVAWSRRFDNARKHADEEMIITTGDDGVARAWALEASLDVPITAHTADAILPIVEAKMASL